MPRKPAAPKPINVTGEGENRKYQYLVVPTEPGYYGGRIRDPADEKTGRPFLVTVDDPAHLGSWMKVVTPAKVQESGQEVPTKGDEIGGAPSPGDMDD